MKSHRCAVGAWAIAMVAMLLCTFVTSPAEARRLGVWYDDGGRPSQFVKRDVIATIQAAMQEWEQHVTSASLILEWRGEPSGAWPPADNTNIVIYWDPYIDLSL